MPFLKSALNLFFRSFTLNLRCKTFIGLYYIDSVIIQFFLIIFRLNKHMPNIPSFRDLNKNTVHSFEKVMGSRGISGTYDSKINNPAAPLPPVPTDLNPGLFGVW
jgi:hypothetical protein